MARKASSRRNTVSAAARARKAAVAASTTKTAERLLAESRPAASLLHAEKLIGGDPALSAALAAAAASAAAAQSSNPNLASGANPNSNSARASAMAARRAAGRLRSPAVQRLVRVIENVAHRELVGRPDLLTPELVAPILEALQDVSKRDFNLAEPWHWRQNAGVVGAPEHHRALTPAPHPPMGLLARREPESYYYHVHETSRYSIGIFILPPGGRIPTHDHPHMCVLSKVLFGDMDVWSYDWASPPEDLDRNRRSGGIADIVDRGSNYSEGMTKVLFPFRNGNMHEFCTPAMPSPGGSKGVGVAILDVILPPYDEPAGRDCTYYITRPPSEMAISEDDDASNDRDEVSSEESADHHPPRPSQVFLEPSEPDQFYIENLN